MADQDPKLRTLQQQGSLNPRPEAVRDERFIQDDFFDPRDLVQVKYEMLRRVETEGLPVNRMAVNVSGREFGLAEYPGEVAEILRETGLDPALLELEHQLHRRMLAV